MIWKEDPHIHGLGCGDNSCRYIKSTGMSTNGGCRCSRNKPGDVERFLMRNYWKALDEIERLKATIEVDKILRSE